MEIGFRLGQEKFKLRGAEKLFEDYIHRINRFTPCQVAGLVKKNSRQKKQKGSDPFWGAKVWVCDREGKTVSSEGLARELAKIRDSGVKRLEILIGGADGFSKEKLDQLKPDFNWSFGPLTLPHELAAVVASEQIYRAFTLIHRLPYHSGHSDV